MGKRETKVVDTTPDAIKSIETYEIARSGWVILLNYIGLDADSTVDAFCVKMDTLLKAANEGRKIITDKIKGDG